jgi:CRP-like cAMP-binding protein
VAKTAKVRCLRLDRQFYDQTLGAIVEERAKRRSDFLESKYSNWPAFVLMEVNEKMGEIRYEAKNPVYSIGDPASVFYIVYSGTLVMETCIEFSQFYKIPLTATSWQVNKVTKKILYTLKVLRTGVPFGYEEIFQKSTRKCRVRALAPSCLIYLDEADFVKTYPSQDLAKMKEEMERYDLQQILKSIKWYQNSLKHK